MILQVKIIGILLIALSLMHLVFPKYFAWKEELIRLSLMNRQLMYVHTFFIAFAVLLMGILCVGSSEDIVQTALGKRIAFGFSVFWAARLFIQFFGYSSLLWKGKKFETGVHIFFSFLWLYFTVIFFVVWLK